MNYLYICLVAILSYLVGSIPFGLLIGLSRGIDPRQHGSNNIGTTNIARIFGLKFAVFTFILDTLKGMAVIGVIRIIEFCGVDVSAVRYLFFVDILPLYGFFSILGHVFSVFLKFKGGKGVATSFGVMLVLNWVSATAGGLTYGVVLLITAYGSLASLIALAMADIVGLLYIIFVNSNTFKVHFLYLVFLFAMTLVILLSHINNIRRLKDKNERRFNIGLPKHNEMRIAQHQTIERIVQNLTLVPYEMIKKRYLYVSNKKIIVVFYKKTFTFDINKVSLNDVYSNYNIKSLTIYREKKKSTYVMFEFDI